MSLSNEHIKIYILTRAELLFTLCYEIPCIQERVMMARVRYSEKQTKHYEALDEQLLCQW